MNCLCGHRECCKFCSPYYKETNDPYWLRERLAEATARVAELEKILREAARHMKLNGLETEWVASRVV